MGVWTAPDALSTSYLLQPDKFYSIGEEAVVGRASAVDSPYSAASKDDPLYIQPLCC